MVQSIFYVNPTTGNDNASGHTHDPLKTISTALSHATSGSTIHLAPGTYDDENGEKFPLVIPEGVTLLGDESKKGKYILITGSGDYASPTFREQKVTLLLENNTQLRGITITNPVEKGTGIWLESTSPSITNCTFKDGGREGIFITGKSKPLIRDNVFEDNTSSGVFLVGNAKGELRRNLFQNTGNAIAISNNAAPLLSDNQLMDNKTGIYLSRNARPVLRRNLMIHNTNGGLVVSGEAQPDLGSTQDPAGNIFEDNFNIDLRNDTNLTIVSVGNELNPSRVEGLVEFLPAIVEISAIGPAQFSDISGHWAESFIEEFVKLDLIEGFPDSTFKPEASLTRTEYAVLIAKIFDLPRQVGKITEFTDIYPDFWAVRAIKKATSMGFISGFPDGTFRPQDNLTRVQVLVSLINGLGLTGGNPNLLLSYRDRAQIPSYATDAISIATQRSLILNYPQPNQLEPMRDITRGEIVAIIYQALVATGNAEAIACPYFVNPDPNLPSFTDLKGHWAREFIRRLASLDLVYGFADGSFKPDAVISRAEYASIIVKVFNPSSIRPASKFWDVPADFWAFSAIQQAYQGGFLSGFPDQTFHPKQNLRRIHILVSLVNGLGLANENDNKLELYEDKQLIPPYAHSAVSAATEAGIVVNYPKQNQLQPLDEVTRAQTAAMVYQGLVYIGGAIAINSPYIVS
ncbi:MAG: DUF1565 domain-containing protein [Moorea sp. SIO2B7]|nr:DUF1565 domain-containing protein [Moorena sp. SIO2B7]